MAKGGLEGSLWVGASGWHMPWSWDYLTHWHDSQISALNIWANNGIFVGAGNRLVLGFPENLEWLSSHEGE